MIKPFKNIHPTIDESASIFEGAVVVGGVTLSAHANVWHNATLRGDMAKIIIGENTNIQDNAVVHTDSGEPTKIGNNVTVGHSAIIHACTIEDEVLIGMGATILNGAVVEKHAIVGAGALVPQGKRVKSGTIVVGNPAKEIKNLRDADVKAILDNANHYVDLAREHTKEK